MISFGSLNYGIIFLFLASTSAYSDDIDFQLIEENLISTMKEIRSEIVKQQNNLNEVSTLVNTLLLNSGINKIENNFISAVKDIKSEIVEQKNNIIEVNTAVNSLLDKSDLLLFNQDAAETKLENAFRKLVERINEYIGEVAKNISLDVSLSKDILMNNQNAVQSKLENALLKHEEKFIDFSETAKNISLDVSLCKEGCNTKRNLTEFALEKISSKLEEILDKNEKPLLPYGNRSNSNGIFNFGTNKTGKENSCAEFSKTFLSVVSALFHINISQHQDAVSNFQTCWKDLPKSMEGHTYFVTPKMKGDKVASYCMSHAGKPFIPKTQEEFIFYVAVTTEPDTEKYSWYPINDIKEEGHVVLLDGADYESSSYKLEKWEAKWPNSVEADCVTMDIFGEGSWSRCYHYDFVLLCQGN